MMVRAMRMKNYIELWIDLPTTDQKYSQLWLNGNEWKQVEEAIAFLTPFYDYTREVSHSKKPTISQAFFIYNDLFDHLQSRIRALDGIGTQVSWVEDLRVAVEAAEATLSKYYSRTSEKGLIYNLATVLDPSKKLTMYGKWGLMPAGTSTAGTSGSGRRRSAPRITYQAHYRKEFEEYYTTHYAKYIDRSSDVAPSDAPSGSYLLQRLQQTTEDADNGDPEVCRYLNSRIVKVPHGDPLPWWKAHQAEFPTLAMMAKDILSIPIASVSTERAFSLARDVIPYRRNRIGNKMIRALMITKSWARGSIPEVRANALEEDHDQSADEEDASIAGIAGDYCDSVEDEQWMRTISGCPAPGESESEGEGDVGDHDDGEAEDNGRKRVGQALPEDIEPRRLRPRCH